MPRKQKGGDATILKDILLIKLSKGQSVKTSPGSLVYMKGDITKGDAQVGSIGAAFARSFGSESFFLTQYTGGPNGGTIALSLAFPGDILPITIGKGESYRISQGCFLACTGDMSISAVPIWKGLVPIGQDEGFIVPTITNNGSKEETLWVGGYGTFEKHVLATASDTMIIDNGIFLACPNDVHYTLEKLGKSLWSSFAGGEGIGMRFSGPNTVVYTQSKSLTDFMMLMSREPSATFSQSVVDTVQKNLGTGLGATIMSFMKPNQDGGKRKKTRKITKAQLQSK